MVIAVASAAVSIDLDRREVTAAFGSLSAVPKRSTVAEDFVNEALTGGGAWDSPRPVDGDMIAHFAELIRGEVTPIDDVRATADYRRHVAGVIAGRALASAWLGVLAGETT
jgi:CO/xanthine dehydrogenase FAD-binding subunit